MVILVLYIINFHKKNQLTKGMVQQYVIARQVCQPVLLLHFAFNKIKESRILRLSVIIGQCIMKMQCTLRDLKLKKILERSCLTTRILHRLMSPLVP